MKKIFLPIKSFLALLTLATLFGLVTVSAQLSSQGGVQSVPGDNDTTRGELASFDRFMDSHPEIAEQLQRDPSLVTNQEFVEKHPALGELDGHQWVMLIAAHGARHTAQIEEVKSAPDYPKN